MCSLLAGLQDNADNADLQAGASLDGAAVDRLHAQEQLQGARTPHALPHDGSPHILLPLVSESDNAELGMVSDTSVEF